MNLNEITHKHNDNTMNDLKLLAECFSVAKKSILWIAKNVVTPKLLKLREIIGGKPQPKSLPSQLNGLLSGMRGEAVKNAICKELNLPSSYRFVYSGEDVFVIGRGKQLAK